MTDKKVGSLMELPQTAAYLRSIGAVARSLRRAVIEETVGQYKKTVARLEFAKDDKGVWALAAPDDLMPPPELLPLLLAEVTNANWPVQVPKRGRVLPQELPEKYRGLDADAYFEMREAAPAEGAGDGANMGPEYRHRLLMMQVRIDHPEGGKSYVPLTWYEDGQFRELEPDVLPIYGAEQIREDHGKRIAYLHEGAKAARGARRALTAKPPHPWARELSDGIHLGWLGGHNRYDDTDWKALREELKRGGIDRVVIVADNDQGGRKALPKISQRLEMAADHLLYPAT